MVALEQRSLELTDDCRSAPSGDDERTVGVYYQWMDGFRAPWNCACVILGGGDVNYAV